jgi:hypothetical protein
MTPLNENQKMFLWLGILGIVVTGLYPPWKFINESPASLGFLYSPPSVVGGLPVKLDITRLMVEWSLVGFITVGLIATAQKAPAKNQNASETEATPKPSAKQEPPRLISNSGAKEASTPTTNEATNMASAVVLKSVKFPDKTLGEVLVESQDDPDYWEGIGEARGIVKIPFGSKVQLEVRKEKPLNLAGLKELDPHALQSIDFSDSQVEDADLAYLLQFDSLYEVDLSHTSISDEGVEELVKVASIKKIWLDNTKITDASLDKLKALQNLNKLSLTGTDISESSVKSLKDAFPKNCEIIMASGIPA